MKKSLKVTAYDTIKARIVNCQYPPGLRLNEELLTEELGISRTPIRDAIGRLEQEGLIHILPKRGLLVAEIGAGDIAALYEMRLLIEPYCIRTYGPRIAAETYLEYRDHFAQAPDSPQHDVDDRFHTLFIEASENPYLLDLNRRLAAQNRRIRIMSGKISQARYLATQAEHLALAEACLAEDWDLAAELSVKHLALSQALAEKLALIQS